MLSGRGMAEYAPGKHVFMVGSDRACLLPGSLRQRDITFDNVQGLLEAGVLQEPGHSVTAITRPPHNDFLHPHSDSATLTHTQ